jgi:hypothetical protein
MSIANKYLTSAAGWGTTLTFEMRRVMGSAFSIDARENGTLGVLALPGVLLTWKRLLDQRYLSIFPIGYYANFRIDETIGRR